MPFKSEKQRKWMWINNPKMAKKWSQEERKIKRENNVSKVNKLIKQMNSK